MQERRPPTGREILAARAERLLGFLGVLAVVATAFHLEEVAARTEFPLGMGALLHATSEAGIHPYVTLAALGTIFTAGFIDSVRRNRGW